LAGIRCRFILLMCINLMGTQVSRQHALFQWQPADVFS
jgi:hypothetical protein